MKITKSALSEVVREVFGEFFAEIGFQPRTGTSFFRRPEPDVELRIGFQILEQDRDGVVRMVCGVGVRFDAIERIIRPEEEFGSVVTVGKPLHLLRPDQEYRPWPFSDRCELEALKPAVTTELRQYALPFFDRYGDYDSVLASLRSESASDWFMSTSDHRDSVLVADALLKSGKTEALRLGNQLLARYQGKPSKYSKPLRELLERIGSQSR